jgi:uncharacterized protein
MPISQAGALNLAALTVPGVYVNIVPPNPSFINGVPTDIEGVVGSASWGPVDSPVVVGGVSAIFGPIQARLFDLQTAVSLGVQQGANNFACVRVTDGTDTAATSTAQTNDITFTSKYTGSFGNNIVVTVGPGSKIGTFQVTVAAPGLTSENFNNIGFGLSGNALWQAIASAVNNGNSSIRGPSNIIVATAGAGTTAPAAAQYTLAGGTDGASNITTSIMVGQNTRPYSGMFALQNSGASVIVLADLTDETSFPTQIVYGLANGAYMVGATPSGDTISNAVATKASTGVDSYAFKLQFGDWEYWLDTANNVTRLVSPQGSVGGKLTALSPQNPTLNAQLNGWVGSQKSILNQQYAFADLQQLVGAGIDVVANPSPGGAYFSNQFGVNASSNPLINSDSYTRVTNFLALTLNTGMGQFAGQLDDPTVQATSLAVIDEFLDTLATEGVIGNKAGTTPYSVSIGPAVNPGSALATLAINIQADYLGVIAFLVINLQGGVAQPVQITNVIQQPA